MTSATTGLSGLAERYAIALFELAERDNALDATAREIERIASLIGESEDLRRLIRSPVISRSDQHRAMDAILKSAGAGELVRRFMGVVVSNRRLFAFSDMIRAYLTRLAQRKGETSAEVVSAKPLSQAQMASLSTTLKRIVGTDVLLLPRVDPEMLGGLIVKIGSRMFDASLRTQLKRMRLAIEGIQ